MTRIIKEPKTFDIRNITYHQEGNLTTLLSEHPDNAIGKAMLESADADGHFQLKGRKIPKEKQGFRGTILGIVYRSICERDDIVEGGTEVSFTWEQYCRNGRKKRILERRMYD